MEAEPTDPTGEVVVAEASAPVEATETPETDEGWTNQTILDFVGETQTRLVSHPRHSTWGRFWWLARFAGDQIEYVAGGHPTAAQDASVATVVED